jgi:hypothetical protein
MATYEENLAQMSQPYQFAPLPIRGGGQDRAFTGLLGNIFGGGGATGLEEYLTPAQTEQMNRQALLQAAIAASQASGPSTVPRSFMQILGAGLAGGQQGYQQAQQGAMAQLMTKMKLDEYRRQVADEKAYKDMFSQAPAAGGAMTGMQAAALPVAQYGLGPTQQRESMIGQPVPAGVAGMPSQGGLSSLSQAQRDLLRSMPAKEGRAKLLDLLQPPDITGQAFKAEDGSYYYPTKQGPVPASVIPADLGAEEYGPPTPVVIAGKTMMVQYNKKGDSRVVEGAMPYEPQSPDIRAVEYIQGTPLAGTGQQGIGAVGQYRQQIAPKNIVNVPDFTAGERGFKNEMDLSKSFKAEPIYKDFSDMQTAYTQVNAALSQGTPIGDVAGATKMMKLLDPGSVVRETELGIAMAASGRMDRLQYYFNNWASGEKLTPTQREDFKQLSSELYAAAGQAYNQKRNEYKDFGGSYGFKNLDTALGAPAKLPSIIRKPAASTAPAPAGTPPNIQDILNKYPPRKP